MQKNMIDKIKLMNGRDFLSFCDICRQKYHRNLIISLQKKTDDFEEMKILDITICEKCLDFLKNMKGFYYYYPTGG
jgi:hydrogenase maturation factor HypF (carbamoyltransferase family)